MEDYLLAVSLPITFVIIAASVVYSWGNLSRLWKAGEPQKSAANSDQVFITEPTDVDIGGGGDNASNKPLIDADADPYEYCGHIQSEVKKARQRVATKEIRQNLTSDDMEAEREAQRRQLEDIFKLMEKQNDKFGMESMDEVKEQMKLYC